MWEYTRYNVGDEVGFGRKVLQVNSCYDCAFCPLGYRRNKKDVTFVCPITKRKGSVKRGFFCKHFSLCEYLTRRSLQKKQ